MYIVLHPLHFLYRRNFEILYLYFKNKAEK